MLSKPLVNKVLEIPIIKNTKNIVFGLIITANTYGSIQNSKAETINDKTVATLIISLDSKNIFENLKNNNTFKELNLFEQEKSLNILNKLLDIDQETAKNFLKLFSNKNVSSFIKINEPLILNKDNNNRSLLDNLDILSKSNIFLGISKHKNKILKDTINLITNPDQYDQGAYGICSQVTKCFYLITRKPSEFVNMINHLTVKGKEYKLYHKPTKLHFSLKYNKSTEYSPEVNSALLITASSMLEFANGIVDKYNVKIDQNTRLGFRKDFDYNPTLDHILLETITDSEYLKLDIKFLNRIKNKNYQNLISRLIDYSSKNNEHIQIGIHISSYNDDTNHQMILIGSTLNNHFTILNSWGDDPRGNATKFKDNGLGNGSVDISITNFRQDVIEIAIPKSLINNKDHFNPLLNFYYKFHPNKLNYNYKARFNN